jgi:nucleoside-diphosphate-sugar epimerase
MNPIDTLAHSTVLVTGASGFIGSHLVDALLKNHCEVHCIVRRTSDLRWLDRTKVHLHYGDLTETLRLEDCLEKTDYVFHCAGLTQAKTREEYFRVNAQACKVLYDKCVAHGKNLKRIVHISSLAAVGPARPGQPVDEDTPCKPLTHYGKSKLAGEEVARLYSSSLTIVILRPPVVYGPREVHFLAFIKAISKGWNLQLGSRQRTLSLIYIADLVQAMLRAAVVSVPGNNVYFITDGGYHVWDEVVATTTQLLNVRTRTLRISDSLLGCFGLFMDFLSIYLKNAPLLDSQRTLDIRQSTWTASSQRFFADFEFQPQYDLKKGLSETVNWNQKNGCL